MKPGPLFRQLSDEQWTKIVHLFRSEEDLCVSDIARRFGVSATAIRLGLIKRGFTKQKRKQVGCGSVGKEAQRFV